MSIIHPTTPKGGDAWRTCQSSSSNRGSFLPEPDRDMQIAQDAGGVALTPANLPSFEPSPELGKAAGAPLRVPERLRGNAHGVLDAHPKVGEAMVFGVLSVGNRARTFDLLPDERVLDVLPQLHAERLTTGDHDNHVVRVVALGDLGHPNHDGRVEHVLRLERIYHVRKLVGVPGVDRL